VNSYPLISFITINYNALEDTCEFLKSARQLTYPNIELIVVDNGSSQDPESVLTTQFPFIHYIRSHVNLGFAAGNNLGIARAIGRYFFFLNNDTILFPDFLEPIVAFMELHPEVGMASPKVLYPDHKTIQYAGARSISPLTGRGNRLGLGDQDRGQYDFCTPTDLGHGAALIVPRKIVERIGPMPENYFLYYEEHDWCEQVKRAGFKMYYLGNSRVIHKEAMSTGGQQTPLKVYYMTRNRLLFMRRNSSGAPLLLGTFFFYFISTPKSLLKYLLNRRFDLIHSFLRGIWWNITTTTVK